MLKILERFSARELLKEGPLEEEIRRMQAKREKKLRRQREEELFSQRRQAVNKAISHQENRRGL